MPGGIVNAPLTLSDGLQILWQPVEHLWFLFHLIFIRVIWYFGELTLGARHRILTMMLLAASAVTLRLLDSKFSGIAHLIENFVFFGIGLVFVFPDRQALVVGGRQAVLAVAVFLAAFWFGDDLMSVQARLVTGLAGSLAVIAASQVIAGRINPRALRPLALIGQASLAIYLIHGIVIGAIRTGLRLSGQLTDISLLTAGTVMGIFVPLVVYYILQTLSAKLDMPLLQWAGLGLWRGQTERQSVAKVSG